VCPGLGRAVSLQSGTLKVKRWPFRYFRHLGHAAQSKALVVENRLLCPALADDEGFEPHRTSRCL
jgi:hypothetical protein